MCIYEQDDALIKSYKTTDYVVGVDASIDSIDIDLSESEYD